MTSQIKLSDLTVSPIEIEETLGESLNQKYTSVKHQFFAPPTLLIQLPETIDSIYKPKLSC